MHSEPPHRLEAKALGFKYQQRQVLQEVSFYIGRAEIVALLGVNGAGKSTLFRLLSGIFPLQSGKIAFEGLDVASVSAMLPSNMRATMGVVFQECSLDIKLNALANLMLSGMLYGIGRQQIAERSEQGLLRMELKHCQSQPVKTFSGGMKRKLELVRAMLHQPNFLLMDEPSAGLDEEGFRRFWEMIEFERTERGMSALLATHRLDEAEKCDRVIVLHQGRIVAADTPQNLKARVKGDRISLALRSDADEATRLGWMNQLQQAFTQATFEAHKGDIQVFAHQGHTLVPRLVEALPPSALEAVQVRRPSLGDAFAQITGERL